MEKKERLMVEGNSFYELDLACVERKNRKKCREKEAGCGGESKDKGCRKKQMNAE